MRKVDLGTQILNPAAVEGIVPNEDPHEQFLYPVEVDGIARNVDLQKHFLNPGMVEEMYKV